MADDKVTARRLDYFRNKKIPARYSIGSANSMFVLYCH